MSASSGKKRPSINLSLFINLSESFSSDQGLKSESPNSPIDFKAHTKSPRNFEGGVVGLGIVAAMNEMDDTHEAFCSVKASRTAKIAVSPRSQPIPIVSGKPFSKSSGPILETDEMELSESYTCVISHFGNNSITKREYFNKPDDPDGSNLRNSEVFFASPPKYAEATAFQAADFLNSCYLCRKKLHGLDIFMYRGDRAFCSVECRCEQILNDEHREKCGSGALMPFDYSVSPCSAPRLFSAGVAAA